MNFNDFNNYLNGFNKKEIVFVGLGNKYRGDDNSGLMFLDRLKNTGQYQDSVFINAGTTPENHLMEILEHKPAGVVFIDSVKALNIKEISWLMPEQIDSSAFSTHAFSIELIRKYLLLGSQIEIRFLGIPSRTYRFGEKLSGEVTRVVERFFQM